MDNSIIDIKKRIETGNSILFCGAGFSTDCKNILQSNPLTAMKLSREICKLGNFEEDEDLTYSSDYLISKISNKIPDLIDLLRKTYTIKEVSEGNKTVCSYEWRRIYTTNYDNTISISCNQQNKYIKCLSIDDNPKDFFKDHNNCIHINGNIDTLNKDSLNNSFKLSHSSYVSPYSFEKSNWYYHFKKDLELCNTIIFIGYSLYDIEIEKILFNSNYKDKTFFITKPNLSQKEMFTYEKYGYVVPVGLAVFSSKLGYFDKSKFIPDNTQLRCLELYKPRDVEKKIDDSQINTFFLYGDLDSCHIDNFVTGDPEAPYLINRSNTDEICASLKKQKNVILYSDFGNGKSVMQDIVKSTLANEGLNVYQLSNDDIVYFEKDIENLVNKNIDFILCFDGYSRFMEILNYLSELKSEHIILFMTERSNNHQHFRSELSQMFNFYEYNVDLINTEQEVIKLIDIINNLGYWKDKSDWGLERKKNYILKECDGQISNILLNLFNSPQMVERTKRILDELLQKESFKKTIFAICIIELLGYHCSESLISDIADNNDIYNPALTQSPAFREIFHFKRGKLYTKSSLFSLFLLNNIFSSSYIIEQVLEIVSRYNIKRNSNTESKSIFKALIRFSFIQNILPEKSKKSSLVIFYQDLKIKVDWLVNDPHFWLQYGMSELMYNNFPTAQGYFDTAYELIKNKKGYDYDSSYIDTQQAKLYLLKSLSEQNGEIIYDYFQKAHSLLFHLNNDEYKYKQVILYSDVYKKKYNLLSNKRKKDFTIACVNMVKQIKSDEKTNVVITFDYYKNECLVKLNSIINIGQEKDEEGARK